MILKFFYTLTVFVAMATHWFISLALTIGDTIDRFCLSIAYENGDKDFRRALLIALLKHEHSNFRNAKANGLGYEAQLNAMYPKPRRGDSNSVPCPEGTTTTANAVETASDSEPQPNMYACIECKTEINLNTFNGYIVCDDCIDKAVYAAHSDDEDITDDVTEETAFPITETLSDKDEDSNYLSEDEKPRCVRLNFYNERCTGFITDYVPSRDRNICSRCSQPEKL